jgi:PAS domain S-box-containing protein
MNNITDPGNLLNYELFFELSPDLLCIAGYDGFFKKVNPAVSQLFGYSIEELYARPINDFVYHEDQNLTADVREQLTKHKPLLHFENRYVTKSGEIVWLSWTSMPVDKDSLIFAIAKNITHKKRLEAERNALLSNLTKVNEGLKQLTYQTSHDLRSPVNNLLSVFSLIDISKISDPETAGFIEILKSAGESLKQNLNNYVDQLVKNDNVREDLEEVDVNECLQMVLHSINSLIRSSNTAIHIDLKEVEKISFNKDCLHSIFLNLISNAIKYARPDLSPDISIYAKKVNDVRQIIFSDNGRGFDMEKVKDKIFGLHQRFHDHDDSKGIGLYLVYTHVAKYGGEISVESSINVGTTFTISFKG